MRRGAAAAACAVLLLALPAGEAGVGAGSGVSLHPRGAARALLAAGNATSNATNPAPTTNASNATTPAASTPTTNASNATTPAASTPTTNGPAEQPAPAGAPPAAPGAGAGDALVLGSSETAADAPNATAGGLWAAVKERPEELYLPGGEYFYLFVGVVGGLLLCCCCCCCAVFLRRRGRGAHAEGGGAEDAEDADVEKASAEAKPEAASRDLPMGGETPGPRDADGGGEEARGAGEAGSAKKGEDEGPTIGTQRSEARQNRESPADASNEDVVAGDKATAEEEVGAAAGWARQEEDSDADKLSDEKTVPPTDEEALVAQPGDEAPTGGGEQPADGPKQSSPPPRASSPVDAPLPQAPPDAPVSLLPQLVGAPEEGGAVAGGEDVIGEGGDAGDEAAARDALAQETAAPQSTSELMGEESGGGACEGEPVPGVTLSAALQGAGEAGAASCDMDAVAVEVDDVTTEDAVEVVDELVDTDSKGGAERDVAAEASAG